MAFILLQPVRLSLRPPPFHSHILPIQFSRTIVSVLAAFKPGEPVGVSPRTDDRRKDGPRDGGTERWRDRETEGGTGSNAIGSHSVPLSLRLSISSSGG